MLRILSAIALCLACSLAHAQSRTFTYQGRVYDASDTPVTGTVTLGLRLFADATGGAPLFEQQSPVDAIDGVFQVETTFGGSVGSDARWVEIIVNGETLAPRQPLRWSPRADYANDAANLGGRAASQYRLVSDPLLAASDVSFNVMWFRGGNAERAEIGIAGDVRNSTSTLTVAHPSTGVYCLKSNLPPTQQEAFINVLRLDGRGNGVVLVGPSSGCAADTSLTVRTSLRAQ